MTIDERIQANLMPVCEECGEYVDETTKCPLCNNPICDLCLRSGAHEDRHDMEDVPEAESDCYDDRDQT